MTVPVTASTGRVVQNGVMTQPVERRVSLPTAPNMRDLGGLDVDGGTIRKGQLFRSAALDRLSDADQQALGRLGIATVYDLRTEGERRTGPDRLPGTIPSIHLDVLADDANDATAGLAVLDGADDVQEMIDALGGGRAVAMMEQSYRKFVTLGSARRAYHDLLEGLADPGRTGAALFHCTAGKDRTGWAGVILLRILGAGEEAVLADYLQTNADLLPSLRPVLDRMQARGVDSELLTPVFEVRQEYLAAADEELARRYGTLERYLSAGLGIGESTLSALRERFVV